MSKLDIIQIAMKDVHDIAVRAPRSHVMIYFWNFSMLITFSSFMMFLSGARRSLSRSFVMFDASSALHASARVDSCVFRIRLFTGPEWQAIKDCSSLHCFEYNTVNCNSWLLFFLLVRCDVTGKRYVAICHNIQWPMMSKTVSVLLQPT